MMASTMTPYTMIAYAVLLVAVFGLLGTGSAADVGIGSFPEAVQVRGWPDCDVFLDVGGAPKGMCDGDAHGCFLLCNLCAKQPFKRTIGNFSTVCSVPFVSSDAVDVATSSFLNASHTQGYYWLDGGPGTKEENVTECLKFIFTHMNVRDMLLLFEGNPYQFIDYVVEHVRFALKARRNFKFAQTYSWETFLNNVLPYNILDEKRDLWWRWRPKFYEAFSALVANATTTTEAFKRLTTVIPKAATQGTVNVAGAFISGDVVRWQSETAPAYISTQQVVQQGGSCTGTAVVLVAAARSVGIPTRIAGCSQSIVRDDDHHWTEFFDSSVKGPFQDFWHTKEGVSAGNAGGPWDAPSGPMNGCLKGVIPGSSMATIWASDVSSRTFLPTQWHNSDYDANFGFVGGENRCGAYCTAWGCGINQTLHYDQTACQPK